MSRVLAALALALLLATPASAQVDAPTQANLERAAAYWGASPDCPSGVRVIYDQVFVGPDANERSGGCGIWTGDNFAAERPAAQCQTIAHGWGHLLGYGEDHAYHPGLPADPVGVMVSYAQPPACAALDTPAPVAAPAPTAAPVVTPAPKVGWKVRRALAIAQAVWRPACGQLSVRFADPAGQTTTEDAAGWASAGDCVINLSNRRHWEFEPLCETVLHEGGHVAGMGHIDDRPSIMNSGVILDRAQTTIHGRKVVTWSNVDRRCMGRGRPFLFRHHLLA